MKRYFIAYDRYSGELTPELPKKQIFDKKKKLRSAAQEGSISLHETLRNNFDKNFHFDIAITNDTRRNLVFYCLAILLALCMLNHKKYDLSRAIVEPLGGGSLSSIGIDAKGHLKQNFSITRTSSNE